MAISDKKLRQVYSTLQKGGYGEDYDTFMRGFAGNENYQNRKTVYDLLKEAGADIGDTYEDFIGNLQSDNKGSGNYVYNPDGISPVKEKKEEVQPVINVENTEEEGVDDTTFADYMRGIQAGMKKTQAAIDRTNKAVEYGRKNLGPNVKPAKLDITDNRNVMEEEVYNPETMQMEKQYTTSYGGTYQDKFSAKQEQDKIDLKNRFDSLQRDIEQERQSVYAEVDAEIEKLQKRIDALNAMKKDGEPKQVEGYRQQTIADLENKIADLQEKRGEFDKEAEFRANKFLYENSGMKEQVEESLQQANETLYEMNEDDKVRQAIDAVQRNSPNLVLRGAAAGAENLYDLVKRWSNPEYGKAVATQRKLSDAAKDTELALGKDDNTWMTHLLRGAWDGATDIRTWDFGINDMTDMGRLYQLQAKADRIAQKELAGEESEEKLTASEQKMLDAIALSNTMEANFSDHVPMSYRVGHSVPESAGFAAAIAMNPASGLGKSIGKQAARRLIANGMTTMRYGKWGVKALSAGARVGGDALEALSTTLTTALPRTVEGVFEDMAGTAQGGYDERGNLVFDKVTDMERNTMKAVGKGIYTNWMENQSEMVGEYFQPIGNFIRQATKNRVWMRNAVDVILGSDDAAKKSLIGKFRDRAKINGVFGEYTEEVYNNVMNAVPWGDMNMTGGVMRPNRADYKTEKEYNKAMEEWRGSVFNAETNVETFLSVTAMIFPMGAAELGGRYLNAYTTKAQLDVAIDNLNKTIGQEQASAIMNEMRNAESLQDMSRIYLTAMQDGRIKDGKQARALLDAVGRLVAYQSVNTSQANSTITEDKFERDYRNAYDAGHEMPIENKHKAGLEYERSMQELDRVLGDSFQGIASMPFEQFQRLMQTLTPEQRIVAQEYYLQSARLAGMRDASMEEADKQVQMHYNTLRRVADKNGIVYRGSGLEEGEFISPESMRIPNSRMLVVLNADNPGASRVIAREEAGEISTSEMDEELRTMQEGLRLKAQNDYLWGVMHNPSTKMPQVGETIEYDEDGSGNGKRMRVIGFNEQGQVQLLPTYIDGETMEEKVSSGEPVVMSQYEALKRQDSYYDALEAEQSATDTEGQTVITPVTDGLDDSNIDTASQTGGLDDSNIETLSQTEQTAPETDATILTDEQQGVIDNWLNVEEDANLVHARIDSVGDDVWSQDTKQAMHQYVDSVRSRKEQTTDEQQEQTTDAQQEQTTDSQKEQTTWLPRDEKGNVLYHKAPIETTVADLMDGSLEDDEIDAFVEANITSAQKEVDKRTKDKPVMTTNKEKYLQDKARWKENLTEAEGILAYWNTVKDAINEKRNAVTETEIEPMTEQNEQMTEQTEPMTEQTESVNGQNESSNESVTESMTEQTDGENAPVQTEGETENDPVQTEGETENTPVQTEGETDRKSLRAEEENEEGVLETQPVIVDPIDDKDAEGVITPIEDVDTEEETQDIFDRAEMLREREQAEKLLGKEIARINRMAKNARWVDSYRKDGTLSRKQIRAMENMASKLGLKIEWHDTMAENGLYDPKTRTIHIAFDAENPIDAVFGHETMHKIAENEQDYEMMRNLAIEILGEKEFTRRADRAEELYKSKEYDYDRAYYEQEVVCDFMGDMLHNNVLLERVSWNVNHRILSAIRDVLDRIISGLGLVDENLVRVRTVVSAAYNNAIRRAEESNEDVTVEEERKASHRRKEEVDAKSRAYFEANKTGLTEQEYAEGQAMMDGMAYLMNPYIDATAKGRRILPEERYGGKDAASTIFSNGSYGKSRENTLICLRTLAYNEFVNAVKRELGRPITQQESFLASQMVYDIATDPQCLYCYVSLDRKAYDEFLLRYMTQRDDVLNKFRALSDEEKSIGKKNPNEALAELYKEFLNGRKDTKEQKNRFNMWIGNEIAGIPTITTADLATSEDREKILNGLDEALSAQVKDAEKYAKSAAWAKKEVDYISYVGELLKLSKNWVNKLTSEYGLRFYSFSEYTPAFLLENMQMVRDAALRGLRGLGYTKEIDFVKVFAPTGMNINCSCYGRLDKDGNMQMDTLQGADWNEVKELRNKYKNVGAVFVATNDAAVEWALAQDWIDVVIPFHIVRTGQDIADFYGWNNYSSEQADKAKQGQRKMYISPVEHKNDKETFLAACEKHNVTPRFAKWLDNPNYMKLVNETRLSVDESVTLKPVFDMEAAEDSWTRFVNKGGYYNGWWQVDEEGLLKAIQQVVEDIKEGKKANEVAYGNQKMPVNVDKMAKEARKKRMHGQAPIMDVFDKFGNVIPAQEIRASVRKGTNAPEMTDEEAEIISKAKDNGTYMKAPNGEPSKLSPRQWAQVRTKAFKEWFGDWENDPANASKVVDENGEPRVVYHQTNSTIFVNKKTGENYDNLSWAEKDYWKNEASEEEWNNTWEERDFYVFDNRAHGRRSVEMPAFFFSPEYDEYHEYGDRTIAAFLNLRNPIVNPDIPNRGVTDTAGEDAMNDYIKQGYDGFIREYDGEVDEINAFFPNQIKSADENIGTFDGNNPDIRASVRRGTNSTEMTDEERALRYEGDSDLRFSLRTEPAPKKTKTAYAVFIAKKHKDGSVSLHPKMIAGEEVGAPPLTWLNADTGRINRDKNGNPIQNTVGRVKVLDSKNQPLAWRPGKHLAPYPNASQFAVSTKDSPTYKDKNGKERSVRDHLPDDVIFFEVEYAADKDYQLEAWEYGVNAKGKYQHSQAGLPYIPKDGYYVYRTNANPDIPAMIITGAYRIKRALNDDEAKRLNIEAGGEWFDRVSGKPITDERLKELGLDEEGLKKKAQTFEYDKLDPAHDESSDAMSMPGYVRRDLNFADENLLKAIEENKRAIPDFPGVEYYEKKYAEEKESETTDDIFSRAEEIRDNAQARASLRNNSRGVGLTYTAMQRAWDREMSKASFFAKEGYWDYLASVDEFQKLIARETGREISSMEDTYRAMLSLSSKNANDMKQFDSLLALPLQKAILKLIGATKNYDRGPGRELCDYMMAKHGIERNRDMAVRNALKEKNTDDNGLDRAAYGNDLDMYYASVDKVLTDAEQNGYPWRLTEELLDQTAESYGADLSVDYSGLQGMYTDEGADEYIDYQTAKQSAIRDVEYYEALKDKDDLEELWDAVRAISSYSLVKQSQSGLTNEDYLRDQMRRYRYFVPLRGFAEDTAEEMYDYIDADRTNGGLGSPVKTAKGHQHKSGDPIGNLLNVAYRSIASGNKNMAISHLYNLATTRDTGGILKVSKIWLENKGTKDDPDWVMVTPNLTDPSTGGPEMSGEDVQAELDRFEKEMQQKKEQGLVMQVTDTSVAPPYRIEQKPHNKSHQIRVNVAGRPRIITVVGNPRLAMAMNGLLNPQTSAWKGLSVLNNFLSAAFTSVNPSFGAANLVRDSLHSNMRMFVSESPLYWAKYTGKQKMLVGNAANWAQMLTMLRDYKKGRRLLGQRGRMFKEFMDGGGATGYTMIRNQEESIQFVKDMMKEIKKGKTSKINPMRLFDLFSYANEAAELVNRFLAYETSREMGRTIERSINDAKEATLNFNRKGAGTKSLTDKRGIAYTMANALNYYSQYGRSFLIFFNAFAQGQRQLWEMAKANPGKFTMAFGVVPAVTAGIALPMLNNVLLPAIYNMASGAGDDDDYVDYYDDLSDWDRHHNLCIRAGKSWIKIPLSPELSSMYALGDVIGGAAWGKREMSASDLMVLADLLVPNNVDTSKPKVTAAAYAPSAVRPLVNVGINMDFMGRPISKEGSYSKYSPAWRKATRSTSKSLTALSRALNAASGGSDERQGVLDINPGYVQEMMTGLAGGYMSTTLAVSDALLPVHMAGGGTEQSFAAGAKALWDRGGVPIISRFYVPGSGERKTSRAKSQYYETVVPMMQKVQTEYSLIRSITREAKQDMVRADARLKDAQASGDTIAIAEAMQGKERAEQALREAAQEQETKTKELMSSGLWKAYTEMLGLTRYVDYFLKVYGQGELPDNVNDAMRSAVEIAKDLDKDD